MASLEAEADISGSQFIWRKYGEKSVGTRKSAVKRAYYRCLCHKAPETCPAKKRVDRLASSLPGDPPLHVVYIGKHNHKPRVALGGLQEDSALEGASKGTPREVVHLQRSGFEKWKPEQLAREMWGDIVVHMAEAAAITQSMNGGPCTGASSLVCRCCHQCGGGGGMAPACAQSICVPLEIPGESADEDLSEGDCPLTPTSEPASPVGPFTTFSAGLLNPSPSVSPMGEELLIDDEASEACSQESGTAVSPAKTHSAEDVRVLVEQLQREIRGRRLASSTELGGGRVVILSIVAPVCSDVVGPEELAQGVLVAVPVDASSSRVSSVTNLEEIDDSAVEFPPLEFAHMDADFDEISGECTTLYMDELFQPGFLLD